MSTSQVLTVGVITKDAGDDLPGLLESLPPEVELVVADGGRVWLYDADLLQVSHQAQADALRGTPALLLHERDMRCGDAEDNRFGDRAQK